MTIRDLVTDDIPQLAMLYRQFWGEDSNVDKMKKKLVELQQSGAYILLAAVEQNNLVGSVMGVVCEELYGECKPFLVIENMVVDKCARQKGVGKALIIEMEKIAKQRNCTQIILVTETDRLDACAFYESVGFHPTANKGYKKKLY